MEEFQDDMVLKETEELNFDSHFLVSPHGHGAGGLALFWRKELNLHVLTSSQNHIDTRITYKNTTFYSTFVYGAPEIHKHQEVWQLLTDISDARNGNMWFLTGDFNEITDNSEKSGGKEKPEAPSHSSDHSCLLATFLTSDTKETFSPGEGKDTLT